MDKHYLGDGVYFERTPYDVTLTTEDGVGITNTIYLEPKVVSALLQALAVKEESKE